MTMKFFTPVRRTLSTHVASMPYVPSGVMRALLDTERQRGSERYGLCYAIASSALSPATRTSSLIATRFKTACSSALPCPSRSAGRQVPPTG